MKIFPVKIWVIFSLLVISGCNITVEDVLRPRVNMDVVNDQGLALDLFEDIVFISREAHHIAHADSIGKENLFQSAYFFNPNCGNLTIDTLGNEQFQLNINYGSTNCQGMNGREYRGRIQINWNNKFGAPGNTLIYSFENFYLQNNLVLGEIRVEAMGKNAHGYQESMLNIDGNIVRNNDTTQISFSGSFKLIQTSGNNTSKLGDDTYLTTGSSSGNTAMGKKFTAETDSPLMKIFDSNCYPAFIQGTQVIRPENEPARVVQYGDGACNKDAEVLINDLTYPIRFQR